MSNFYLPIAGHLRTGKPPPIKLRAGSLKRWRPHKAQPLGCMTNRSIGREKIGRNGLAMRVVPPLEGACPQLDWGNGVAAEGY